MGEHELCLITSKFENGDPIDYKVLHQTRKGMLNFGIDFGCRKINEIARQFRNQSLEPGFGFQFVFHKCASPAFDQKISNHDDECCKDKESTNHLLSVALCQCLVAVARLLIQGRLELTLDESDSGRRLSFLDKEENAPTLFELRAQSRGPQQQPHGNDKKQIRHTLYCCQGRLSCATTLSAADLS